MGLPDSRADTAEQDVAVVARLTVVLLPRVLGLRPGLTNVVEGIGLILFCVHTADNMPHHVGMSTPDLCRTPVAATYRRVVVLIGIPPCWC